MYKGTLEDVIKSMYQIEKKLDPVNPKAVKKDFDNRKDKDIDNDGDVDSSDKYLHKRRKAVSKAVKGEDKMTKGEKDKVEVNPKIPDLKEKKDEVKMPDKMSKMMDKIVGQLNKSVKGHAKQAEKLKKIADKDKVDEVSKDTLRSYSTKASDASKHKNIPVHKQDNRVAGVKKAAQKLGERKLTDKEMKKREDVAQAIKRDNPKMPMDQKMAIATSVAKKTKGEDVVRKADVKMVKVKDPNTGQMIMKKVHPETQSSKFNESVNEDMNYKVSIEGLPDFFVSAKNPGEVKLKMRKMLKKPDMLSNVERVPDAAMKKHFRLKAQGKDEEQPMKEEVMSEEKKVVSENKLVQAVSDILSSKSFNSFRNVNEKMSSKEKMAKGLYNEKGMTDKAPGDQEAGSKAMQKKVVGDKMKGQEKDVKQGASDLHMCAKDVMHEKYGRGNVVHGMHSDPDENGHVSHYDIMFNHGIEKNMPIAECEVVNERMHGHKKKDK